MTFRNIIITFYFEIILDPQRCCKNSTEFLCILHPASPTQLWYIYWNQEMNIDTILTTELTQIHVSSFASQVLFLIQNKARTPCCTSSSYFLSDRLECFFSIFFWPCWVFIAAHRLCLVAVSRGYASLCAGFGLWWLLWLRSTCSSCSMQAWSPPGKWDLPGPGIKPLAPALAGRFLNHWTTREVAIDWILILCLLCSQLP